MITSIGGSSAALSLLARVESRKTQEAGATQAGAGAPAPSGQAEDSVAAVTRSAQSDAVDRLGEQLNAQADAARVREASSEAEAPPSPSDGMAPQGLPPGAAPSGEAASNEDDATAAIAAAGDTATASSAPAGAAGGAGVGGAASSSESESTDYIAEADTNNDRKVSEEERIAYEKKQAQQAEKSAQEPQDAEPAQRSREQEVRQAYAPEAMQASLDVTA